MAKNPKGPEGPKKPRFTVKTKQKTARSKSVQADPGDAANSPAPPVPIERRLIEYVGASRLPEVAENYGALLGAERPFEKAPASDLVATKVIEDSLIEELRNHLADRQVQIGIGVSRYAVVPGNAVVVPVPEIKKAGSLYRRAKLDTVSIVRPCPVPGPDPAVPGMALDLVTVMLGEDLLRTIYAATVRARGTDSFTRSRPRVFEHDDPGWEPMVRSAMFAAPLHGLPEFDPFADEQGEFEAECAEEEREFITLMVRSQLPLAKAMFGLGRGKNILKVALTRLEESTEARCKGVPAILQQNAIVHHWFAEVRRLDREGMAVPIVLLT